MRSGLILEGGGMRGLFTAGVLDAFLDEGFSFDSCLAVSAGACHACSFLSGQRGRALRVNTDYLEDRRYCSLHSLLQTGDLFGAQFCYHEIPEALDPVDNKAYRKSDTYFFAVVTNCATGRAEYHPIADLERDVDWVRASASLPYVSRMVELEGQQYLDGGIADSIPLAQSVALGNQKHIVVLTQPLGFRKGPEGKLTRAADRLYAQYPALQEALRQRSEHYNAQVAYVEAEEEAGRAFVLRPERPLGVSRTEKDKTKLNDIYLQGASLARRRAAALRDYLSR